MKYIIGVIIIILILIFILSNKKVDYKTIPNYQFSNNMIEGENEFDDSELSEYACLQKCRDHKDCIGVYFWPGDFARSSRCIMYDALSDGKKYYEGNTYVMKKYKIPKENNNDYYADIS